MRTYHAESDASTHGGVYQHRTPKLTSEQAVKTRSPVEAPSPVRSRRSLTLNQIRFPSKDLPRTRHPSLDHKILKKKHARAIIVCVFGCLETRVHETAYGFNNQRVGQTSQDTEIHVCPLLSHTITQTSHSGGIR